MSLERGFKKRNGGQVLERENMGQKEEQRFDEM
jgi:hypothetical protein